MTCAKCGAAFEWSQSGRGRPRKYCDGCRRVDVRSRYTRVTRSARPCLVCGVEFVPTNSRHVSCSRRCKDQSKPSAKAACSICGGPAVRGATSADAPTHNRCLAEAHDASRYRKGCRCDTCRTAIRDWWRGYRARREALGLPVPSGGRWISDRDRLKIYERDGWCCHLCGGAVDPDAESKSRWYPSLDHLVPRSQGGSDDTSNLKTAHRYCNAIRQDQPLEASSYVSPGSGGIRRRAAGAESVA